jgi:hypothetical protein
MLENLKTEGKEAMITKRRQQLADKERKDKKKKKKLDDSDSDWMPNRKERLK